ncbi:hypothetical protein [Okeania sp. SIO2C9]|nr:hypothetical protein [Okeania sp. SIO2C9]
MVTNNTYNERVPVIQVPLQTGVKKRQGLKLM